jgi:FkbM family methyltransferase
MRKILRSIKHTLFGENNYPIKKKIETILNKKDPVIIEAGAHIGSDTIEMSRVWPGATIHAFEPIPSIYKELLSSTKKYKNITTHPLALSNATGDAEIFVSSGASNGSSSLLTPKEHIADHPDVHFRDKIKIKTITLDEWAVQNNVDHVDFAWLDMQGFELPVLKASRVIAKTLKVIYTEVSLKEMYEGSILYPELKQWMIESGFRIELEDMPFDDFGNVLFVKD